MQIYMLQTLQMIVKTDQVLASEISNTLTPVKMNNGSTYFIVNENIDEGL